MSASRLFVLGRTHWPALPLDEATFAARLARLGGADPDDERAADLFLAFAVAERVPGAIEAFDERVADAAAIVHRRFPGTELSCADLRQLLVTRICVGDSERAPAIESYRGRGSLRSWLRVSAVRVLTDASRAAARRPNSDVNVDALAALGASPDVAYLQRRFGDAIKHVLEHALTQLSSDERALLRQRYLHGLQVDEIASLRGIHRVTASRLLSRVHERLLKLARRALERERGIDLEALMHAVRSGLELSLSRVLGRTAA